MRMGKGEEVRAGAACACIGNYDAASVKLNVRMGAFFMSCVCLWLKNVILWWCV